MYAYPCSPLILLLTSFKKRIPPHFHRALATPLSLAYTLTHRNYEYLPPRRSLLHLPPLLLHAVDRTGLGHYIHTLLRFHHPPNSLLRLHTLRHCIINGGYRVVLFGGKATGTGDRRIAGEEETTGALHASGECGDAGVRILF